MLQPEIRRDQLGRWIGLIFEVVEGIRGVFGLSGFTHASYSAAVEKTKPVLGRVGQFHVYGAREGGLIRGEETYGVLFLYREFEIDGVASCVGYFKL